MRKNNPPKKDNIIPFNLFTKPEEPLTVKDLLKHFTGRQKLSNEKQEQLKQLAKDLKNL